MRATLYGLDRTGFRELMNQQAVGRALAHAALISTTVRSIMSAQTNADFDMPEPPEGCGPASAADGSRC